MQSGGVASSFADYCGDFWGDYCDFEDLCGGS